MGGKHKVTTMYIFYNSVTTGTNHVSYYHESDSHYRQWTLVFRNGAAAPSCETDTGSTRHGDWIGGGLSDGDSGIGCSTGSVAGAWGSGVKYG